MTRRRAPGFTLIEILVAISILVTVAAVLGGGHWATRRAATRT